MFNSGRGEREQWQTCIISSVIKRLGFKRKRASDGKTGYIWDENTLNS